MQGSATSSVELTRSSGSRHRNLNANVNRSPLLPESFSRELTEPISLLLHSNITSHRASIQVENSRVTDGYPPMAISLAAREQVDTSDTSSICHSPGWDNYGQKMKTGHGSKGKRRKEKAKQKKEGTQTQKANRLVKRPPKAKEPTRAAILLDRSASSPVVEPMLVQKRTDEYIQQAGMRSRKESLVDLKGQITGTHAVLITSKSAQAIPSQGPQAPVPYGSFIGGLKLKLERDVVVQEEIRKQISADDSKEGYISTKAIPAALNRTGRCKGSNHRPKEYFRFVPTMAPEKGGSESKNTKQEEISLSKQNSFAARIAREQELLRLDSSTLTPIMHKGCHRSEIPTGEIGHAEHKIQKSGHLLDS